MGRAEELFARIEAEGETALDQMIADAEAEQLFLDFKQSNRRGADPVLHADDATNFSKAISGFGNSEGGLIIWGVDAPNTRGAPTVLQKTPLVDAPAFRVRLEGATSRLSVPAHPLVRNRVVLQSGGPAGFVATLIPAAAFGPVRAIQRGTDKYYIRAGDSFVNIPHDALAGMFGRKPSPVIWPQFISRPVTNVMPGNAHVSMRLGIYNKGPVLAERPYVSIHPLSGFAGRVLQVQNLESTTMRSSLQGNKQVIARGDIVVAPGGLEDMCDVHFVYMPPVAGEFRIQITVGARSTSPIIFELYSSVEELVAAYARAGTGDRVESTDLLHLPAAFPNIT